MELLQYCAKPCRFEPEPVLTCTPGDRHWNTTAIETASRQNTNLHLGCLRNPAEIKWMPSRLIRPWRPYDCDITHTWGNGTVPITVATTFGGFLTFIWFCYLVYATLTSNNDGDRRKIAIPFMTNHVCTCIMSLNSSDLNFHWKSVPIPCRPVYIEPMWQHQRWPTLAVTIQHGHDTIRISICVSRYDPYLDTYNIWYFLIIWNILTAT